MFFFFVFLLQPRLVNFPRINIVSLFIDTHHLLDIELLFCHKRKGTKKKLIFLTRFNVVHQLLNFVLSFQYLNNWWKLYSTKACRTIFLGRALWEEIVTFGFNLSFWVMVNVYHGGFFFFFFFFFFSLQIWSRFLIVTANIWLLF